ncbi:MAG: hypothetical protein R3A10_16775 [Caldilineaceae bacterium]
MEADLRRSQGAGSDAETDGYYTPMREDGLALPLCRPSPFHAAMVNTVQPFIWKALSGELTPKKR